MAAAQSYDVSKYHKPKKPKSSTLTLFAGGGSAFILMIAAVPLWNAFALIQNFNYTFWAGVHYPRLMICGVGLIILFYLGVCVAFFRKSNPANTTADGVMNLATIFISILGLFLMIVSLPIQSQANFFEDKILYHCKDAQQVHRVMEYSQVLQNIRALSLCKHKYTVEDCHGYQTSPPYTDYLRQLENDFKCAGFCANKVVIKKKIIFKVVKKIVVVRNRFFHHHHFGHSLGALRRQFANAQKGFHKAIALGQESAMTEAELEQVNDAEAMLSEAEAAAAADPQLLAAEAEANKASEGAGADEAAEDDLEADADLRMPTEYPPTLFSDANYLKSCEGMAARDMQNTAGDIGRQTFFQGLFLVTIAVMTGFLKLLGYCVRKHEVVKNISEAL